MSIVDLLGRLTEMGGRRDSFVANSRARITILTLLLSIGSASVAGTVDLVLGNFDAAIFLFGVGLSMALVAGLIARRHFVAANVFMFLVQQ